MKKTLQTEESNEGVTLCVRSTYSLNEWINYPHRTSVINEETHALKTQSLDENDMFKTAIITWLVSNKDNKNDCLK